MLLAAPAGAAEPDAVARGAYLANAADCAACHTDAHGGLPYAGGRALATPFGTFYSPNITPDPETGIGRWSDAQFLRALHEGVRPDGANYFPVFPYPSFTKITDADVLATHLWEISRPAFSCAVSFGFSVEKNWLARSVSVVADATPVTSIAIMANRGEIFI